MAQLDRSHKESAKAQNVLSIDYFLHSGKYRPALFGGAIMLTVLLGIYGCSKETSKPAAASPERTVASQPINPDPSPITASTPTQPATRKRRVQRRDPLATYRNPAYGISMRYPKNYVLREGNQASLTWPGSGPVLADFIKPGGVTLAAIQLPGDPYLKKNLTAAFVNVSVNSNLTDSECARFASPDPSLPGIDPPSKVKIGVLEFDEMEDLTGQATKRSDARYYHVFRNGACYEFALGLGMVGDGTVDGKMQVSSRDVFRKLETVLSTARINSVALPKSEIPSDSRSNPQPSASPSVPSTTSE
jgi:hypothetical protein